MSRGKYARRQVFDEVVVERLMRGEFTSYRFADRWEVIRRMVERGYHDGQIAHALRAPRTAIHRTRKALGIAPVIRGGSGIKVGPIAAPTRPRALK